MRIAIVEDEDEDAALLEDYLQSWSLQCAEPIELERYADGREILDAYSADCDLILMDIDMANLDGMSAAERIRARDDEVVIIFITNLTQYAIRGYTVGAFDYVLKPISSFALAEKLNRVLKLTRQRGERFTTIRERSAVVRLAASEILWAESKGHRIIHHTLSGTHESTTRSLGEVREELGADRFSLSARGILVNLERVTSIKGSSVFLGDAELPISRGRRREFLEDLTNFTARNLR